MDTKEPIHIVSSYRSPATNAMLRRRSRGVAQFSQHMLGKAIDFHIPGVPIEQLRAAGMRLQRGGVGFYPGSFVHVDVGAVRHWPRMTHDQLARVFPNGRTVHIPSNGQPMSGYALALADIEKRGTSAPSGMSLAAARNAGAIGDDEERVASAAKPKKGNVLAKLFGFSTDEDEDEDQAGAAEPRRRRRHQAGGSENSAAAGPPGRHRTEAGRQLRAGVRRLDAVPAARAQRAAPAGRGPRADRSRRLARDDREHHTSWLNDAEVGRTDRVPPGVALAYAANAAPDAERRPVALTPPMGAARAAPAPAATTQVARIPPKAGQRYNDPWMRAVTLATSLHHDMNVTVYGRLDVRQVRMMMIKPVTSVPMTFGADPYDGMQTLKFAGAAVTFLPTIPFGQQQQASLR